MALDDWRKSPSDILRFYKPNKIDYSTRKPASETLNAVKFGMKYKVYHDKNPHTAYLKPIKIVGSKKEALRFMIQYMRNH